MPSTISWPYTVQRHQQQCNNLIAKVDFSLNRRIPLADATHSDKATRHFRWAPSAATAAVRESPTSNRFPLHACKSSPQVGSPHFRPRKDQRSSFRLLAIPHQFQFRRCYPGKSELHRSQRSASIWARSRRPAGNRFQWRSRKLRRYRLQRAARPPKRNISDAGQFHIDPRPQHFQIRRRISTATMSRVSTTISNAASRRGHLLLCRRNTCPTSIRTPSSIRARQLLHRQFLTPCEHRPHQSLHFQQ